MISFVDENLFSSVPLGHTPGSPTHCMMGNYGYRTNFHYDHQKYF